MRPEDLIAEVVRHRDSLLAVILAMTRNFHVAEDVMQETMVEIMRSADRYNPEQPLLPWAKGIARNMVRRHWQSTQPRHQSLDRDGPLEYLADILDHEIEPDWQRERQALHICLQKISPKNRSLLELRYAKGLQGKSLAEAAGIALGSLANTYARLRQKLRVCVRQQLQEQQ